MPRKSNGSDKREPVRSSTRNIKNEISTPTPGRKTRNSSREKLSTDTSEQAALMKIKSEYKTRGGKRKQEHKESKNLGREYISENNGNDSSSDTSPSSKSSNRRNRTEERGGKSESSDSSIFRSPLKKQKTMEVNLISDASDSEKVPQKTLSKRLYVGDDEDEYSVIDEEKESQEKEEEIEDEGDEEEEEEVEEEIESPRHRRKEGEVEYNRRLRPRESIRQVQYPGTRNYETLEIRNVSQPNKLPQRIVVTKDQKRKFLNKSIGESIGERPKRERKEVSRYIPPPLNGKLNVSKFPSFTENWHKKIDLDEDSSDSGGSSSDDESVRGGNRHNISRSVLPQPINSNSQRQSKADVDPMELDPSATWDSVGGLDHHIKAMKEMVTFPLLYPEVFQKFGINPPKGVLFYGPPGTGKTLVARALANTCSNTGQKVAFFMRKGADVLTKWVGEAERQLRLLFQQAHQMQPAIIFFDEIDGLAPVRSSKQDQIHSSIVSTLLALMDGLDSRGKVVVIGATNRIDSIDPALRRPGRFDREFLFGLPSKEARNSILSIHTKSWNPPLEEELRNEIAENSVGYCGADIKALCTEAALSALRRRYPQIYESADKLLIDVNSIQVLKKDFIKAMRLITPTAHRTMLTYARKINPIIAPLIDDQFENALQVVKSVFPCCKKLNEKGPEVEDDSDDNSFITVTTALKYTANSPPLYRPRMLVCGNKGDGQGEVAGAILHYLEEYPVSAIDIPSLFSNPTTKTLEESFIVSFKEAIRKIPSVIYLPHVDGWWKDAPVGLKCSFVQLLDELDPTLPVLLLATSDVQISDLENDLKKIFGTNFYQMKEIQKSHKIKFFGNLREDMRKVVSIKKRTSDMLEKLPKAPIAPKEPSQDEIKAKNEHAEEIMRTLRMFLRARVHKLHKERRFHIFFKHVNPEQYPYYYEQVKNPIDLSIVLDKIDHALYTNIQGFAEDINTIVFNASNFHPLGKAEPLKMRNLTASLQDKVASMLQKLDPDFVALCDKITAEKANEPPIITTQYLIRERYPFIVSNSNFSSDGEGIEDSNLEKSKKKAGKEEKPIEDEEIQEEANEEIQEEIQEEENEENSEKEEQKSTMSVHQDQNHNLDHNQELNEQENVTTEAIIDKKLCKRILKKIVEETTDWTLEKLIRLRTRIYNAIWNHRTENNKEDLLQDMQVVLSEEGLQLNK